MSDAIRVTLTPDSVHVMPDGDPVEILITITNTGATVDQYAVELDQLPTTWYSLSNTSVALFPQDKEEARLVIQPPKGGGAKAGTYPFTVTVLSRADPTQTTRVEGTVQVGAVAAFEIAMTPTKVTGRRKGRYKLNLRNGGNADLDVLLDASDSEEGCRYTFKPKNPHLPAGQKAQVNLKVKARRSWIAGAKKSFDFTVKAEPTRGDVKQVKGTLVSKPLFRTWRPMRRLAYLLAFVALVVAVLYTLGGPNGIRDHLKAGPKVAVICDHVHVFCGATTATATPPVATPSPITSQTHPTAVPPGPQQQYAFIGAFDDFHHHEPKLVGTALELEHTNSRVATQTTSNGLLLFDRKDGHTFLILHDNSVYLYFQGVTQQVR